MEVESSRGIPKAPFVDVVENFLGGDSADVLLTKFNETLISYRRMEASVEQRRRNLDSKIPELKKAVKAVQMLRQPSDEERELHVELCDSLYAKGKIPAKVENVGVWLGANVMLEYSVEEAETLLKEKLDLAEKSLKVVLGDLEYLREQITTMEVNIARVYNWDVKQRRSAKK